MDRIFYPKSKHGISQTIVKIENLIIGTLAAEQ